MVTSRKAQIDTHINTEDSGAWGEDGEFDTGMQLDESGDIDFSGVDSRSAFPVLPRGTYRGEINDCEFRKSESGNYMLAFEYSFSDGSITVKVWDYVVFASKTMSRARRRLEQLVPNLPEQFNARTIASQLRGVEVAAKLKIEKDSEYGDKNKIIDIVPLSAVDPSF